MQIIYIISLLFFFNQAVHSSLTLPYKKQDFSKFYRYFGKPAIRTISIKPSHYPGVIIALKKNSLIYAMDKGKVIAVCNTCKTGKGNFIKIQHHPDTVITYYHLSEVKVEPGALVLKGQEIGLSGNSGLTTVKNGLGIQVKTHDVFIDPIKHLRALNID